MNINLNQADWFRAPRTVCGIMTGTSLDGIDVALCRYKRSESRYVLETLGYETYAMPPEITTLIRRAAQNDARTSDISYLNFALAHQYAEAVSKLCCAIGFRKESIDAVGVHGQTVWHSPSATIPESLQFASTMQIGSPSALAALLGLPVIGDFRSADIALGGQGAPLVPVFDYELLRSSQTAIVALNIGGIANITYIPAGCSRAGVLAFDTGAGNMLIDYSVAHFFGMPYDSEGEIAESGSISIEMLNKLMSIEFIAAAPPKSTGRELFSLDFFKQLLATYSSALPEDFVATLAEFTAQSIVANIEAFADASAKLVVSGGGAKNAFLMRRLRQLLPMSQVLTSTEVGINTDAKEAIAFAFLAYLRLGGVPANLPSVTGASRETLLGGIFE